MAPLHCANNAFCNKSEKVLIDIQLLKTEKQEKLVLLNVDDNLEADNKDKD